MVDNNVVLRHQDNLARIVVEQFSRHSAFSRPSFDKEGDDFRVPIMVNLPLGMLRELKEGMDL